MRGFFSVRLVEGGLKTCSACGVEKESLHLQKNLKP